MSETETPAMLAVIMQREVWLAPDARGDRQILPRGWSGEVDADAAGYLVAMDYGWPVGEWPQACRDGVDALRGLVQAFRAQGVEPGQHEVYSALALMAAQQADAAANSDTAPAGAEVERTPGAAAKPARNRAKKPAA